jgi:hypothetical protein
MCYDTNCVEHDIQDRELTSLLTREDDAFHLIKNNTMPQLS